MLKYDSEGAHSHRESANGGDGVFVAGDVALHHGLILLNVGYLFYFGPE